MMMKEYAKTKDYVDYLEQRFKEADKKQMEYIDIVAREIHGELSEKPTLPTCCSAMRKVMREGDKILTGTENASGYSTKLKIRYFIKNREEHSLINLPKRRGRPAGLKKEKKVVPLADAGIHYLEDCGIRYEIKDNVILAQGEYGIWKIYIDSAKRESKNGFSQKLFDLLTQVDDIAEKHSLLIMSNQSYEKEWMKLSDTVKHRLNLSLLKCTPHGRIKEFL